MLFIYLDTMALKKKKASKKKSSSNKTTHREVLEEIIRVDHAGEYGATKIYDGQIAIFGKSSKLGKTIQHMADQEQEHIDKFNELILEHRVRPTALLPLWNVAGYALGASTALMGEKAAMACTVTVEKVIGEHYQEQIDFLYKNSTSFKLLRVLEKCCDEEVEHQVDAKLQKGNDKNTSFERFWSNLIGSGSSLAVNISKQY